MVTAETCEPEGCTSLYVEWSYDPVCPEVDHVSVRVGDIHQNVDTNTTDLTVTGLEVEEEYRICIDAVNKEGYTMQYSCMSYYCKTPAQGEYCFLYPELN